MSKFKHPADEYLEDFAEDRFYGERTWNVLEQEPANLYKLDYTDPIPQLRLWASEDDGTRLGSANSIPNRSSAGFWPLAIGGLIGGLLAAKLGAGLLVPFGVIGGMLLGSFISRRG